MNSALPRIACFGYAESTAGSVSSAGFVVLRELLARGYSIDFFNKSNFVRPRELESNANYRFIDVPNSRSENIGRRLSRAGEVGQFVGGQLVHGMFAWGILRAMRREHARRPYDLQLWLGSWAWGRLLHVPVVSWVQGPPDTDGRSIGRRRVEIKELAGPRAYWPLRAYAAYRATLGRPPFRHSDVIIVGSAWSCDRLAEYDVGPARVETLPYPTDLSAFSPAREPDSASPDASSVDAGPVVLWLGRTVPRKRLDLFLDACAVLIRRGLPIRVRVVGGFGFLPQYAQLIERFAFSDRLTYSPAIPRDDVLPLLRSASVLVQPSEDENFGSSVAEALACGTPVVLGPTNGTGDYCGDAAVRFDRYDAEIVADAIAQAIANLPQLRPLARRAAERAFDVATVTDRLVRVLQSAVVDFASAGTVSGVLKRSPKADRVHA